MNKLILQGLCLMMVSLCACSSDDDPKPIPEAPRSMITEFVWPTKLSHRKSDFNVNFVVDEATNKIVDIRITDYNIIPLGKNYDYSNYPEFFVEKLRELGDTCAPDNLPEEAWNYLPSIIPIRSIRIYADTYDICHLHLKIGDECTKYFEISYISYYDFIKNGYSWDGIENPGPVYKMTLEEFNKIGDHKLVDTNGITLYPAYDLQDADYTQFMYNIDIEYGDGTTYRFRLWPIGQEMWERLRNIMKAYNEGKIDNYDWNLLKSPKR